MKIRTLEFSVGLFLIAGITALAVLALQVSGLTQSFSRQGYYITAVFDNIGDLKPRAPITIAGVRIGQVASINLDPTTYQADVLMKIESHYKDIPVDSSVRILTQGLLGSNYLSIEPGYKDEFLKNGDKVISTHSALILENLIGQLLFKVSGNQTDSTPKTANTN